MRYEKAEGPWEQGSLPRLLNRMAEGETLLAVSINKY